MLALAASLVGLLTSFLPDILKFYKNKADANHELLVMDRQIEAAKANHELKREVRTKLAEARELKYLYENAAPSKNPFMEALASSVRPVISYLFFFTYMSFKIFIYLDTRNAILLWTEEDHVIFCTIISFWFGYRTFKKNGINGKSYNGK